MPPRARINNMNGVGGGPQEWFESLPLVTKYWFGATLLLTVAGNLKIVHPAYFFLDWEAIKDRFEIWRILTCFCYAGKFEFPTLIALYLLMNFSQQYEMSGPFNTGAGGGTADYAFMWLFGAITMIVSRPLVTLLIPVSRRLLTRNMIYFVLYVWSKRHPTSSASIWGFPVKAIYLPFCYVLISLFIGAPYMDMVHGILIGHVYYFLVDVVPHVYGKDVLQTPQFLMTQFGVGQYIQPSAPTEPAPEAGASGGQAVRGAPRAAGGHNWGQGGQRLGAG